MSRGWCKEVISEQRSGAAADEEFQAVIHPPAFVVSPGRPWPLA